MRLSHKILIALTILAAFGCGVKDPAVAPSDRPVVEAETVTPRLETLPDTYEVTGRVASGATAVLSGKITALVEDLRVREGDRARQGDLLIALDRRDLEAQLARARAELSNAAAHYERTKRLHSGGAVSTQELDDAERALKVAEAAQRAVESNLAYTEITAPFDGVVTEKLIERGELVTPGRPLLRIEDTKHLRLEATVAESEIAAVRPGQKVTVRVDAMGGLRLPGRVALILPSADPASHTFTVKTDLPIVPGLKSGLFGRMLLPAGTRTGLFLPASSVREREGLYYLFVAGEAGLLESRLVKIGKPYEDRVEILSGLEPGETVLLRAADGREGGRLLTRTAP
jgi:RND family efflux transporter MFP subunit